MKTKFRLALLLWGSALSGMATADPLCDVDYVIQHSWQTGAVHRVLVNYHGSEATGWQLTWSFPGQERIDSIFNVTHNQSGQDVTVTNLAWNAGLRDGSQLKFGFNVDNPSGDIPAEFFLNGESCGAVADTPDPNPGNPESPDEPDLPETNPTWSLDTQQSFLGFVSTKNTHTVESHSFGAVTGSVSEDGIARLSIDLDTVETGFDSRNQRLRELLFNTAETPSADVSIELGDNLSGVLGLTPGDALTLEVPASVQISGQTRDINAELRVERLTNQRFLVSSARPLIIAADQFELQDGVEALREAAALTSISIAVPVDFALFFETDELPTP